jgi:hypothetical protein
MRQQNKLFFRYLIVVFLPLFFVACHKKVSFPFRVINTTEYTIHVFQFDGSGDKKSVAVAPFDTSETVILSYTKGFRLMPRLLGYGVHLFSDSLNEYSINIRYIHPFSKDSLSADNLNTIIIKKKNNVSLDTTTNIFYYEIK